MAVLPERISHIISDVDGVLTHKVAGDVWPYHRGVMEALARHANSGVHVSLVTARPYHKAVELFSELESHGLSAEGRKNIIIWAEDGRVEVGSRNEPYIADPRIANHRLADDGVRSALEDKMASMEGFVLDPFSPYRTAVSGMCTRPELYSEPRFMRGVLRKMQGYLRAEGLREHVSTKLSGRFIFFCPQLDGKPVEKNRGARNAIDEVARKTGLTARDVAKASMVLGDAVRDFRMCRPHGLRVVVPGYFAGLPEEFDRFPRRERERVLFDAAQGVEGEVQAHAIHSLLQALEGRIIPFEVRREKKGNPVRKPAG